MNPFDRFGRVYVINAISNRRQMIEKELDKLEIPSYKRDFVSARIPDPGLKMSNMRRNPPNELGANMSHAKAVMSAIADQVPYPLFIEDDVIFDQGCRDRMVSAIKDLDEHDWRVFYLGGHPCEDVVKVGDHLFKVGRFSFAESYSLAYPQEFMNHWFDRIGQPHAMFDQILGEYARKGGYCVYPLVTNQPKGFSYISQNVDDKTYCVESGWRNHT